MPARVAAAVGALVVRADPYAHIGERRMVEDLRAELRVALDQLELLVVKRVRASAGSLPG